MRDNNIKRYLKLRPKKHSKGCENFNNPNSSKLHARSERGSSLNKIRPKNCNDLLVYPQTKKLKMCRNTNINGHSMSIETQFNKHQSLYECNTQQVSAVKIPADLISDKKCYQSILKDSRSIDTQKNLFLKTAKNGSKSRKRNNLVLHNSRNPSVGDSRYSSSLITVKKPAVKSRLFKHKKTKKCGVSEIHSNKSNSSIRKACTPMYMFRQTDSRLDKRGKLYHI
jgi:hypothetical protein